MYLTVRGDGNTSPCCTGSELSPHLSLGNAFRTPVADILRNTEGNLLVNVMAHRGPGALVPLVTIAGHEKRMLSSYTSICHLCNHMMRDRELADSVTRLLSASLALAGKEPDPAMPESA